MPQSIVDERHTRLSFRVIESGFRQGHKWHESLFHVLEEKRGTRAHLEVIVPESGLNHR